MADPDKTPKVQPAADAVQLAILDALKALTAEVSALKAAKAAPADASADALDQVNAYRAKKRAELKASTFVDGEGLAHYIVRGEGYYRQGVTYAAGQEVAIPKDEDPVYLWDIVVKAKGPTDAVLVPSNKTRAADR